MVRTQAQVYYGSPSPSCYDQINYGVTTNPSSQLDDLAGYHDQIIYENNSSSMYDYAYDQSGPCRQEYEYTEEPELESLLLPVPQPLPIALPLPLANAPSIPPPTRSPAPVLVSPTNSGSPSALPNNTTGLDKLKPRAISAPVENEINKNNPSSLESSSPRRAYSTPDLQTVSDVSHAISKPISIPLSSKHRRDRDIPYASRRTNYHPISFIEKKQIFLDSPTPLESSGSGSDSYMDSYQSNRFNYDINSRSSIGYSKNNSSDSLFSYGQGESENNSSSQSLSLGYSTHALFIMEFSPPQESAESSLPDQDDYTLSLSNKVPNYFDMAKLSSVTLDSNQSDEDHSNFSVFNF